MDINFRKMLRAAYEVDYGMANIYEFGKVAHQWTKKVAFDDPYVISFLLCTLLYVLPYLSKRMHNSIFLIA